MVCFKIYVILLMVIGPLYGQTQRGISIWNKLPTNCGETRYDNNTHRIVDGEKAQLGQFPWIVLLGDGNETTREIEFFCGGSLISRYYVISAAHCQMDANMVRIGENDMRTTVDCDAFGDCAPQVQDIKIANAKRGGYDESSNVTDISLIELERPAEFNEFVQPVCLSHHQLRHEHKSIVDKYVTIAGWGATNTANFSLSTNLLYVTSPVVNPQECNTLYQLTLKDSQYCIGYQAGKDSCVGDAGGPATMSLHKREVRRSHLIGIVSYGLALCGRGVAVYTDVSYYVDWILREIEKV